MSTTSDRRPRRASRVAALLVAALLLPAAARSTAAGPIEGTPPYPPSGRITDLTLDWSTFRRQALQSDNWPATWAADGQVYAAWGDGGGFGGDSGAGRVSLGLGRLSGDSAATLTGTNLVGGLNPGVARCWKRHPADLGDPNRNGPCHGVGRHGKVRSLLARGTTLFAWVTPGSNIQGYAEARLYKAPLGGNDWRRAGWAFTRDEPDRLLSPAFVQAGRNYKDGGDHLYAYANRYNPENPGDAETDIMLGGEVMLLRAPRSGGLFRRESWQFFAGPDASGAPTWTGDPAAKRPAIVVPEGVGRIGSGAYVEALGRYLFVTEYREKSAGYLAVLEAPEPWGPWRTVAYTRLDNPNDAVDHGGFYYNFLPNGWSADGTGFTLPWTGGGASGGGDALLAVDGRLTLGAAAP